VDAGSCCLHTIGLIDVALPLWSIRPHHVSGFSAAGLWRGTSRGHAYRGHTATTPPSAPAARAAVRAQVASVSPVRRRPSAPDKGCTRCGMPRNRSGLSRYRRAILSSSRTTHSTQRLRPEQDHVQWAAH
jgi:hypothetical protein